MIGARACEMYDEQAKQRMKSGGGDHKSSKAKSGPVNLPDPIGDARDAAGKAVAVSGRTVDFATKVLTHGTPELVKTVDERRMPVSTAIAFRVESGGVDGCRANGSGPVAKPCRTSRPG